ncbi:MAG: hypothetical protein RJQ14_07065 [Marinoscillum sp.]
MKNQTKILSLLIIVFSIFITACEESSESGGNDCYTCDSCSGDYAHLLNGREYCVDGFDNRSDWESNKNTQQTDNGCTCE